MSKAPIIFKVNFYAPNTKSNAANANAAHVKYIATRPGVEMTDMNIDKDIAGTPEQHVKYAAERPGSCGLFGNNDEEATLKDVMAELSKHDGIVWRSVISLTEEDAVRLQYDNREQWEMKLRTMVPDIAKTMRINESNLRWQAAFHIKKGHPHVHLVFWEKNPERTLGVIKKNERKEIKRILTREIFAEERSLLNAQKTAIRDLINNMVKEDLTETVKLIKDVKNMGLEIAELDGNLESIPPQLKEHQYKKLIEKITDLASIMPQKGRIALAYMPTEVKEKVKSIADYILSQPGFKVQIDDYKLKARGLAEHYTRDKKKLEDAENKAYSDIRDRVCQVILKAAAESIKNNTFFIDKELSEKAVSLIKNLDNKIDIIPEQTKVLEDMATTLFKLGKIDKQIIEDLSKFIHKENIDYQEEQIEEIVKMVKENKELSQSSNILSSSKKVDYYLSVLKATGYSEEDAFKAIREIVKKDINVLDEQLKKLESDKILVRHGEEYIIANEGVEDFLKNKKLDKTENEVLKIIEKAENENCKISFQNLLDNKDVFDNLFDKDPQEFKVGKFDIKVNEEFGDNNRLNLKELEKKIFNKYTNNELKINAEKAEREFNIFKNRIKKLMLNGYIKYDNKTETYSFTDEGLDAIANVSDKMEFTKYDANVTLSYIDKAENGVLVDNQLKDTIYKEISNQTAKNYYKRLTELLETDKIKYLRQYISIDDSGIMTSTEKGKWLSITLNKLNKYFYMSKGLLTDDKLHKMCIKEFGKENGEIQYKNLSDKIQDQIYQGHIEKSENTGVYKINSAIKDISQLLYQIYKEGGALNKSNLNDVLEKNIDNKEAKRQYDYIKKRLVFLKQEGYLQGDTGEYRLIEKGLNARADILIPERDLLKNNLEYLSKLGLIENDEYGYKVTEKYYQYKNDLDYRSSVEGERGSLSKDICELIDHNQGKINIGKMQRNIIRSATGKHINRDYENIKTNYEDIRSYNGVDDTVSKTIYNLSTALLASGVNLQDSKEIVYEWNLKSDSCIETSKMDEIIDKASNTYEENKLWGKPTIISTKEWKEMFKNLGVEEKYIPKWIYKDASWQSTSNIVNGVWRAAWRGIEKEKAKTQAKTDKLKRKIEIEDPNKKSKKSVWEIE